MLTKQDKKELDYHDKYLEMQGYYKTNLTQFLEDCSGVKLHPHQKLMLKLLNTKDKFICFSRFNGRKFVYETSIEMAKQLEMDFTVWKPECIEKYKKGKLVKVIKHE